jgi:hypothetical protein
MMTPGTQTLWLMHRYLFKKPKPAAAAESEAARVAALRVRRRGSRPAAR